jgi:L-ascorbate metabolism protein UlaG (beta-lactamase superfamily)
LRTKFIHKAVALKKQLSRRRFLTVGGAGAVGSVVSLQATHNLSGRFVGQRLAELGKPAIPAKHHPKPSHWSDQDITASWLGHATVLINFYGLNVITDPVLFSRVGAYLGIGTIGPMRRQACALKASQLPPIHLVLLSHAHFDHFDIPSLSDLPGNPYAVTARNTSDLLQDTGLTKHSELKWGEKVLVSTEKGEIEVEAFEVRHWGARWRHDVFRGYNGYILNRGGKKIIFGGDTAMCDGFKGIRSRGPFDFACMPIGAYNPWIKSHCNPEEALRMANEAGARRILPMHHYTFRFGREHSLEPIHRLQAALASEPERLGWKEAGETFVLKA